MSDCLVWHLFVHVNQTNLYYSGLTLHNTSTLIGLSVVISCIKYCLFQTQYWYLLSKKFFSGGSTPDYNSALLIATLTAPSSQYIAQTEKQVVPWCGCCDGWWFVQSSWNFHFGMHMRCVPPIGIYYYYCITHGCYTAILVLKSV